MVRADPEPRRLNVMRGPAEDFVISGYRTRVSAGETCPDLSIPAFPLISAEAVASAFAGFVEALKQCAACPLSAFRPDDQCLSRDELLVLSLVSALQHGDDETTVLAASTLTCPGRVHETIHAAAGFAMLLKVSGAILLPVSAPTLRALTETVSIHNRAGLSPVPRH